MVIIKSLHMSSHIWNSKREENVNLLLAFERFPLPSRIICCVRIHCSLSNLMRMGLYFSILKLVSFVPELSRLPQRIILPDTLKTSSPLFIRNLPFIQISCHHQKNVPSHLCKKDILFVNVQLYHFTFLLLCT